MCVCVEGGGGISAEGMLVPVACFAHLSRFQSLSEPPLTVAPHPHTVVPLLLVVDLVFLPNPSSVPQYFSAPLLSLQQLLCGHVRCPPWPVAMFPAFPSVPCRNWLSRVLELVDGSLHAMQPEVWVGWGWVTVVLVRIGSMDISIRLVLG